MRQVLGPGALGRPRGIGWRERWEGGSGWGIHVNQWLIHVNVWQKPLQYSKIISLQLIKINGKKKERVNRKAMDLSSFAFRRREKPATSFIVKKETKISMRLRQECKHIHFLRNRLCQISKGICDKKTD